MNEKLLKINHAFPLVSDCIEQLGQKCCHYLSFYGSPTCHYLQMGMGMSVSPQIWQQFVDLVFQDDLIKHKQNFDVIMDDT